jgi:putative ABC transport system ATP-binding protein
MSALLDVKDLTKVYGRGANSFKALNGLSLSISKAETVAIVGKSGSGKSTLMHLLALLDTPTSGSITFDGQDVASLKAAAVDTLRNQEFGFVFQQFFLNANDTVLNNVCLPLKIAGVSFAERRRRGEEALKAVDLLDKAKNKATDLSGGQKQRVCIARALVNNPGVIFADEPTGNLDSTTGGKIEDLLFELNKERGITVIFVTHDEDLAARCDRQINIRDGKIVKAEK